MRAWDCDCWCSGMLKLRNRSMGPALKRLQTGMSVVEFMVGVALGLLVVAATALMVSGQMVENRKLLLETQIQQDLRAATDIVTRELRRSSYFGGTTAQLWYEGRTAAITENAFGAITPSSGTVTEVNFAYRRRSGDEGPYGYKLEGEAIKSMLGTEWQVLTDTNVMRITGFSITVNPAEVYQLPCPKLCTDGTQDCWPELQMRTATVTLTGQSRTDTAVTRTLSTDVRLRNDWTHFNGAEVCPS